MLSDTHVTQVNVAHWAILISRCPQNFVLKRIIGHDGMENIAFINDVIIRLT